MTTTMESQNRKGFNFLLLGLLYLAADLVKVRADSAVNYEGKSSVSLGEPWEIKCTSSEPIEGGKYIWTRNGQKLPADDLQHGLLQVDTDFKEGKYSIVKSPNATEDHDGVYKCLKDDKGSFTLEINLDIKIIVLLDQNKWVDLPCPHSPEESITWLKDDKEIKDFKLDTETTHIQYINKTGTLQVTFVNIRDRAVFGKYTCKNGFNTTVNYRVVPKPNVAMPENVNVVEGEKLHLTCGGKIEPGIKIQWTFKGKNYTSSEDRVKLSKDERGILNAVLKIENITMEDRGNVTCRGSYNPMDSSAPADETTALIRVKDKYAALWPFLGICAEVIILCTIILIYEKKTQQG